jgi:hypothetical protein
LIFRSRGGGLLNVVRFLTFHDVTEELAARFPRSSLMGFLYIASPFSILLSRRYCLKEAIRVMVSAIEEKMEAIVHSTRSERDKNIQRRNENVTECQEIPKEKAAVASLKCEGQGHKELEFGAERQLVPAEEVARKS